MLDKGDRVRVIIPFGRLYLRVTGIIDEVPFKKKADAETDERYVFSFSGVDMSVIIDGVPGEKPFDVTAAGILLDGRWFAIPYDLRRKCKWGRHVDDIARDQRPRAESSLRGFDEMASRLH